MSEFTTANISVLGKNYQLKCKRNELEHLKQAGAYLDMKMQEAQDSGNGIGFERTAMMAALNVCFELITMRKQKDFYSNELNVRLQSLSDKISRIVDENHIDLHPKTVGEQQQMEL